MLWYDLVAIADFDSSAAVEMMDNNAVEPRTGQALARLDSHGEAPKQLKHEPMH